jgi:hypothetical protein
MLKFSSSKTQHKLNVLGCFLNALPLILLLQIGISFAADVFSPDIAWNAPNEAMNKVTSDCMTVKDPDGCFMRIMSSFGASKKALEFTKMASKKEGTTCYAYEFVEHGKVDLVKIEYPIQANTGGTFWLVNGNPEIIDVNDNRKHLNKINYRQDKTFKIILSTNPGIDIMRESPAYHAKINKDGGQSFIFSYPLQSCRACEAVGSVDISFDFDAQGNFKGPRLVQVSR